MTTAPHEATWPTPPAPGQPPPPPTAPRRGRRGPVAGVIAVLLLLAAGAGATWWLTHDEDGSPLAGRPRVTDRAAGLSYGIPEGWQRDSGDLLDAFTSSITMRPAKDTPGAEEDTEDDGSVVLAGRGGPVPSSALRQRAEDAARSNAEFFYPDGRSALEESQAVEVGDRPAHTVALTVHDGGTDHHLRLTLVSVRDDRAAFLLGVAQSPERAARQEVDTVLESAAVL
ncbi:hypothetical protein HUT19_03210 [Streptomyces sp. NA02950]|uniref:hypothetical protein n=1 Tax=Streptomyces sp. NA02950 TaxID=2742137 RepID=UPI00158FB47D|nr:hypothetical protein [Streptomyces sp. NA02950]QKV90869.1 hypothetical protein HUT19_03210 [Streptomyces sp. NA02950]